MQRSIVGITVYKLDSATNLLEMRASKSFFLVPLTGLGGLIASSLEDQLLRWLRAAELTCDRAALLVAQDPKVW